MRHLLHRGAKSFRDLVRTNNGAIAVEFAAILPVLVLLGLGIFELSTIALEQNTIESAAKAGVQYGTQDFSTANDPDGMVQAALNDIGTTSEPVNVSARQYCSCPNDGELPCTDSCKDGSYSPMYVQVNVQTTKDLLFHYPGFPDSISLSATSEMRIR